MSVQRTFSARACQQAVLALLVALLWCLGSRHAYAAATITGMTINGQTTANVVPGSNITVRLFVTLTNGTRWRMTRVDTAPVSSLAQCYEHEDVLADGNYVLIMNLVAPTGQDTHSMLFELHPNANCSSGPTTTRGFPDTLTTDSSFPSVVSIVRIDPTPTNLSPVRWTVTFDRPVTGVTLGDFAFAANGVTGTALSGSYTSNDVYTLETPNTGSGTLGLNVVDNDSITGPNGRALGGAGAGNGSFTGEVYTIDRTPPTFPSASIASTNIVNTAFARIGDTVTVTFTTADAGGVQKPTAFINGVAATVTGAGNDWVASRVLTAADAEGLVGFRLEVKDVLGNTATARTTVTNASSVTIDNTAPTVSITCASPAVCGTANPTTANQVSWTVTFSEAVTGLAADNFSFSGSGAGGATIASISGGPGAYTVTANVSSAGEIGLDFSPKLTVRDRAGNSPAAKSAVAGNTYTKGGCSVAAGGGCTFDAVETGAAAATPIFTKRVGALVKLDLVARNGTAINTSSSDKVQVTLVLANGSACSTTELSDPVEYTFAPANAGRLAMTLTPKRAGRNVRVRMVSSGVTACSTDNFALRPDSLTVATDDAIADPTGVSAAAATAAPVFKAGSAPYGLRTSSVVGYDGTPKINLARIQVPTGVAGAIAGAFGAADPATGVAKGAAFTYSEVGYFRLRDWGVYDDGNFAAVDRSKVPAECFDAVSLTGSGVPLDPNPIRADGKYGCYFGSAQSSYFGRFIPDHFAMSAADVIDRSALTACAASPFTYMGEVLKPTFVLTAQNAANATTVNYTGDYARLTIATQLGLGVIDEPAAPAARRPLALCLPTSTGHCLEVIPPSGTFTNGVSDAIAAPFSVKRPATPLAPLTALKVGVSPIDPDGVRLSGYNLDTVSVVAGAPQRVLVGTTMVRYGRLQIDNAYGSELLNLTVKVAAQFWNGSSYLINTLDSCTPLDTGLTIAGHKGGITPLNMKQANVLVGTPMTSGSGRVVLTRPTPAPATKGSAALTSGNPNLPGSGRATFGVYKAGPVIYMRETY